MKYVLELLDSSAVVHLFVPVAYFVVVIATRLGVIFAQAYGVNSVVAAILSGLSNQEVPSMDDLRRHSPEG